MHSTLASSGDLLVLQKNYSLIDVEPTGKKIGQGAYGYVEKVIVNGAYCAAKKVHRVLLNHRNEGVENFKQKIFSECVIMSKLRHPHIVQFLGVYFPNEDQKKAEEELELSTNSNPPTHPEGLQLPWLIMELLPTNLAHFLDQNVSVPYSVKVSLLVDISKGLCYLHSQRPPIIHRDLTANNILINSALVAKIADFGVARIAHPLANSMSVGPGAIAYMPPEVHSSSNTGIHANYSVSVDMFSFGVNILYTIIQQAPLQISAATYVNSSRGLIAVTEVQRRKRYFDIARECLKDSSAPEFQLIELSERCLDNEPSVRPTGCRLLSQLNAIKRSIEDPLLNSDMYHLMRMVKSNGFIGVDHTESRSSPSSPMVPPNEQLRIRVQQLETEKLLMEGDKQRLQADKVQLEQARRRLEAQLVLKDQELSHHFSQGIADERRRQTQFEAMQADLQRQLNQEKQQVERLEQQLNMEKQISEDRRVALDMQEEQVAELQAQLVRVEPPPPSIPSEPSQDQEKTQLKNIIESHKEEHIHKSYETQATIDKLRKELELLKKERKSRSPPSSMPPTSLPPSLPESGIRVRLPLFWKNCHSSPSSVHCGQCVLFDANILYGGGTAVGDSKRKIVRFDLRKLKWEEFSLYLYEYFSMAVVLGKLLVVGGYDAMKDEYSNRLSEWRDGGSNWVRISGSPLPVPRSDAVAIGYKKWLIVAGGFNGSPLDRVDILDCETFGAWHSVNSLPQPAYALQSAFYQDKENNTAYWYLTSTNRGCGLNRQRSVYFISVNNLTDRRGTWQVLPEPPLCNSAPVTVRGHLLVVGGHDQHSCKKDVHMFFFGTREWLKVAELQIPRHSCSCVPLSDRKFVVIGGQDEEAEYSCRVSQYNITYS